MSTSQDIELSGTQGRLVVRCWSPGQPRYVALIAHGYAEHSGRYSHVADRLTADGAVVYAPDHAGHGRSEGEKSWGSLTEDMATDLRTVAERATTDYPGLPVVLIGHSLGGVVATRYVQRYGTDGLAALVLSGPVIGGNPGLGELLALEEWPEVPIDPAVLSRDPAVGQAYVDDPLVFTGPLPRGLIEEMVTWVEKVAKGGGLGQLPTLWLHGEEDQLAPLAATRPAVDLIRGPSLTEKIYPGARHEVFNEINSGEVLDDLIAFLDRHVPEG